MGWVRWQRRRRQVHFALCASHLTCVSLLREFLIQIISSLAIKQTKPPPTLKIKTTLHPKKSTTMAAAENPGLLSSHSCTILYYNLPSASIFFHRLPPRSTIEPSTKSMPAHAFISYSASGNEPLANYCPKPTDSTLRLIHVHHRRRRRCNFQAG